MKTLPLTLLFFACALGPLSAGEITIAGLDTAPAKGVRGQPSRDLREGSSRIQITGYTSEQPVQLSTPAGIRYGSGNKRSTIRYGSGNKRSTIRYGWTDGMRRSTIRYGSGDKGSTIRYGSGDKQSTIRYGSK